MYFFIHKSKMKHPNLRVQLLSYQKRNTKISSNRKTFSKKGIAGILKLNMFLHLICNWGQFLPPQGRLGSVWRYFHLLQGRCATDIWWVEARDAAKYLMMHRTDPTNKDTLGQNVYSAHIKNNLNPGSGQWISTITACRLWRKSVSSFPRQFSQFIDFETPHRFGPKFLTQNYKIQNIVISEFISSWIDWTCFALRPFIAFIYPI